MRTVVVYLLTGPSHLANLAVSLVSLRRHWSGDVLVFAWPESQTVARQICADVAINAQMIPCDAKYRRKNAQEIHKIALIQEISKYDMVVYLDADTIIMKPIERIADAAAGSAVGFAGTQFGAWRMPQGIPVNRVSRLRQFPGIDQECVEKSLLDGQPSYNSGIFATTPQSPVLPVWGEWTTLSKSIYISGECSLHPIAQKFPIAVLYNGVWNCSPMYQARGLADSDVGIWHFHGDCNTRPQKSERGVALWWPEFQMALNKNIGNMQEWVGGIGNEFLDELMVSSQPK